MPKRALLRESSFKLWPFKYHSQLKNGGLRKKRQLCDQLPDRLFLKSRNVCLFGEKRGGRSGERDQFMIGQPLEFKRRFGGQCSFLYSKFQQSSFSYVLKSRFSLSPCSSSPPNYISLEPRCPFWERGEAYVRFQMSHMKQQRIMEVLLFPSCWRDFISSKHSQLTHVLKISVMKLQVKQQHKLR